MQFAKQIDIIISRVLIGPRLIFCLFMSPICFNLSRKCTPIEAKVREKV